MANNHTLLAIRGDIESFGNCLVPIDTLEHYLGAPFDDDDDCDSSISSLMSGVSWATSYEIDWINRRVLFRGPQVAE